MTDYLEYAKDILSEYDCIDDAIEKHERVVMQTSALIAIAEQLKRIAEQSQRIADVLESAQSISGEFMASIVN